MTRTAFAVLLAITSVALPADPAPTNTLTPKEIEDGWVLLFDSRTTFGWTSPNDSKWTVADGMLAPQKGKEGLLVTTTAFGDYELVVDLQKAEDSSPKIVVLCDGSGKGGRKMVFAPFHVALRGKWQISMTVEGGVIKKAAMKQTLGGGEKVAVLEESPILGPRHIALEGSNFIIHSMKLRPRSLTSLFNGKDLTGWKKYEADAGRAKSKFTVTKEGWLSLKDGPGDLQTEGQWADFVLQLECKVNGDRLNSGVFFRCLPGQYQQGYEAQIHNGFGPAKEYALDVWDPEKKQLVKKTETYTALDFGTGAVYRRQPARLQSSTARRTKR
jgi:hypothetical protein